MNHELHKALIEWYGWRRPQNTVDVHEMNLELAIEGMFPHINEEVMGGSHERPNERSPDRLVRGAQTETTQAGDRACSSGRDRAATLAGNSTPTPRSHTARAVMLGDDAVNHPKHYNNHPSGVECIAVTEHMNFCRGNAMKYLWRAGDKGNEVEDLKKARWYLDREIARLEKQGGK